MTWDTEYGSCIITEESIKWIIDNVKESMYNKERCYVYNKAFARYFDNNDPYKNKTITGGLSPENQNGRVISRFDKIRLWAEDRGLYDKGDPKTQTLKLMEEAGEICRAVLKDNHSDIEDGIGDAVVVLTNLAELQGTTIEDCIERAYNEIKDRTGHMNNGTFKKD
jgi:NTP pyrophosphatase (non-canonical NTP hydrolase)